MITLLEGWKKTMDDELDFRIESQNMTEVKIIYFSYIPSTVTIAIFITLLLLLLP